MIHKLLLVFGVTWLYLTGALAERNCDNRLYNVLSIHSDLGDRNTGYGVLLGTDEYNITWIHADSDHPVSIEWRFLVGETEPDYGGKLLSWGVNITDSHYIFKPYDLFAKMASSPKFNLTETEIRSLASGMINVIFIRQPEKGDARDGWQDTELQFSVQNGWVAAAARAQYDIGKQKEANKWKLGVGIGVGLGVPFMMAVTGLLTWWFTKKLTSTEPPKLQPNSRKTLVTTGCVCMATCIHSIKSLRASSLIPKRSFIKPESLIVYYCVSTAAHVPVVALDGSHLASNDSTYSSSVVQILFRQFK
ncbi:hypothetical protein NW754_013218 [Fusarium falciforme]|nr:hypothetical protein NW754_013218 [Fusarium falciforme]